jgi:taurine dioxygenase
MSIVRIGLVRMSRVWGSDMEIRHLSPLLGSELVDVDLAAEPEPSVAERAAHELDDRHLVLVRGQELSLDDQVRFVDWFGDVRLPQPEYSPESTFELYSSNALGERGTGQSLEFLPHQDYVWSKRPLPAICLYAMEVSEDGGETIFTDLEAAYEQLSPELKDRVRGLQAMHVGPPKRDATGRGVIGEETDISDIYYRRPDALETLEHTARPVVSVNPRTGREVLLITKLQTHSIEGLAPDEGAELLGELVRHLEDETLQYRHRWQVGDIIIWDNVSLLHARTAFPPEQRRTLRKLQVDVRAMAGAAAG